MKEFIKNAKNGLTIGFFASVIMIVSLIIYTKAWQSSSSGLTVDNSSPAALYVGAGETLTAAKRNRLVQKSNREEISTSDTALFDTGCERRFRTSNGHIYYAVNNLEDGTTIYTANGLNTNGRIYVSNTNKALGQTAGYTITKLRKKCQ